MLMFTYLVQTIRIEVAWSRVMLRVPESLKKNDEHIMLHTQAKSHFIYLGFCLCVCVLECVVHGGAHLRQPSG